MTGNFEITLEKELIFSKKEVGDFPETEDVQRIFSKMLSSPSVLLE